MITPFKLEQYFSEYEFVAKHLMSSSDCEPLSLEDLLARSDQESMGLWTNLRLAYTETPGLPLLRQEIASLYSGIHPDQVLIAGPQEGIFLAMQTLLNQGDEVVCTFPGYQSLYEIARSKSCPVKFWCPDANHHFRIEDLEKLLTDKTRMLVINFPHNPTGAYPSLSEYQEIIRLCERHQIRIFSDEMYRGLEYDPARVVPSAVEVSHDAVVLSGMSKTYSLPGLRVGWLIIRNPEEYQGLINLKHYTTICPPAPSEILALMGLRNRQWIIGRNLKMIAYNKQLMEAFAAERPDVIRWIPPKAGSVAFPELLLEKDIEKFCRCLVDKTGVMLLPGSVYDYPGRFFRVGLGRQEFGDALEIFKQFLK